MKLYFKIACIFLLCRICFSGYSQSKTTIINKGIASKTIIKIDYENDRGKERLDETEKFDVRGNTIEHIKYNNNGDIDKRTVYEYNSNNELIKETKYDKSASIKKTTEYVYTNGLKTQKIEFNENGVKMEETKYQYEFN